jgi:HEPN domain-containing protein
MQISGHDIRVEYVNNIFFEPAKDRSGWDEWIERLQGILDKIPPKADELKPIIQFIVTAIAPTKIFMLKNPENFEKEYPRYIDLLVVISGKCAVPFTDLEPLLELASLKDEYVCCSLHNEGSVIEGLKNGHPFYSLNFIPENLVYDDLSIKYQETTSEALFELKRQAKEKFNFSFQKAKHFYELAIHLHESCSSQILPFLLHQSVEQTYRSVLKSLNGYDKKTHEIRSLKKHIRRCAKGLNGVFPDNNEEEKRLLDILEAAYIDSRYGDTIFLIEEDVLIFMKRIRQLQDIASKIVSEKLGS